MNNPLYYIISILEIAALRPNMRAAFSPQTPYLAVSAISRVFGRLATFIPLLVKYITDKTTGANGEGGHSKTCNLKRVTYNPFVVFPLTPFIKSSDRCGPEATPEFLVIEKQHAAAEQCQSNCYTN